jgi:hypothetical protein
MALYGEISKDYRTVPSMFPAKNLKTIIPTLGELWSASAASCGTRVQRNENPNEKMEKNETMCFGTIKLKTLEWRAIIS